LDQGRWRERIIEDSAGLVEVDAMLRQVRGRLVRVLLQKHAGSLHPGPALLGLQNTALSCGTLF